MAIQVRVGGTWKPLTACKVFSGGAWRGIGALRVRSGAAWREVALPENLAATISPSPFAFSSSNSLVTGTLSVTPTGGTAPYTYAWSVVTFDNTTMSGVSIFTPTAASTTVQGNVPLAGHSPTATIRCTVTTALGNTTHVDVSGTFTHS